MLLVNVTIAITDLQVDVYEEIELRDGILTEQPFVLVDLVIDFPP